MKYGAGLFLCMCVLCASATRAEAADLKFFEQESEDYRRLIWTSGGLGAGYSNFRGLGLAVSGQSMFQLTSKFALGVEVGALVRMWAEPDSDAISVEQYIQVPQHFKVEFRPGKGRVRPFFGLGVGRHTIVGQWVDTNTAGDGANVGVTQVAGNFFGGGAEAGLELGRVRLTLKYAFANGADVLATQSANVSTSGDMSDVGVEQSVESSALFAHYFAFEIGRVRSIVLIRPSPGSFMDR